MLWRGSNPRLDAYEATALPTETYRAKEFQRAGTQAAYTTQSSFDMDLAVLFFLRVLSQRGRVMSYAGASPTGFEPVISAFAGRRLIRWTTVSGWDDP